MEIDSEQVMNVTNIIIKNIGTILSIGALVISILAIIKASKDNKKQIIVGKIEEIYEITTLLFSNYSTLILLNSLLDNGENNKYDSEQQERFYQSYIDELKKVKENISTDELFDKTFRLNVLGNAYLDKKLKLEVLSYAKLFENLLGASLYRQRLYKMMFFKEGFPTQEKMYYFFESLETQFINKINLGEKHISLKELEEYREEEFKRKLGLK